MRDFNVEECNQQLKQLNDPFPYEAYEINYDGFTYISPQMVINRLNDTFGLNWETTKPEYEVDKENLQVYCKLGITVHFPNGHSITRYQAGSNVINTLKNSVQMTKEAIGDSVKSACSDALKKCASLFGCGSDLYQGKIEVIKPGWNNYVSMKTKAQQILGLSDYDSSRLFEKGVYYLPDDYRPFYEAKGWKGVFKSDLFGGKQSSSTSTQQETTTSHDSSTQPTSTPSNPTNHAQHDKNKKVTKNQVDKLFKKLGEQKGLTEEMLLREVKSICPYIQFLEDVLMSDKDMVMEHLKKIAKVINEDAVEILRKKAQAVQAPDSMVFGMINKAFGLDPKSGVRSWNEMKGLSDQGKIASLVIPRSQVLVYNLYQDMIRNNFTEYELVESYNAYATAKGVTTFDPASHGLKTLASDQVDLDVLETLAANIKV